MEARRRGDDGTVTPFAITLPRIRFGRGEARHAVAEALAFGPRGVVVHGANPARAGWLIDGLGQAGAAVHAIACPGEPTLAMLEDAVDAARGFAPDWVLGLGGGAAIDLAKAVAALVPAPGGAMDHLEVVGRGLPLSVPPLPFLAIPTTAGTGAEVTRNAVIGVPAHRRKVSLRDPGMIARLAIVDPALTDDCPWEVTLASGLDALAQVIEPYVSTRANAFTDALARPAIGQGLAALRLLRDREDPGARDAMAWVSLAGGIALSHAGLGAVHGLAGPLGGVTEAPHGAICGALLPHVLAANRGGAAAGSHAAARLDDVLAELGLAFGVAPGAAAAALAHWAAGAGLPRLGELGLAAAARADVAQAALTSSSMRANPVPLSPADLVAILVAAD